MEGRKISFMYIIKKLWELFKIIFSIGERRISLRKGFILFILGGHVIVIIVSCIFGVNLYEAIDVDYTNPESEYFIPRIVSGVIYLIYFWGYLRIKRTHDHGLPRYMSFIPIVNLFLMRGKGDEGENEYGEKPSFKKKIKEWWTEKSER